MLGRHVGVYEVVAKLGEGGMGEVYRARDSRLKRDVALKVLPASVAGDAHRLSRFEREAQVLAALNHPNIAAIYGIEQGALVLELVEGPTLADMIAADRLPLREALSVARQICDALAAAHEQGIVHRDLKPANIKVRPDGSVKILDFGLAKAIEAAPGPDVAASTITSPAVVSAVGVILGTAAYMSPEQARGKPVDKRSDVWAFGCVLFEMLTGRRAFDGDSVTDTLSRVLQREPDFSLLPADIPQTIRRLLRRCLEKDRQNRLPHIAAATFQIDEALAALSSSEIEARDGASAGMPTRVLGAAILLSVVAGAAGMWAMMSRRDVVALPVTRLQVGVAPAHQLGGNEGRPNRTAFDISPDGRTLVFSAQRDDSRALYRRPLDQPAGTTIPGTDGALNPVFSPDGQWIAFHGSNQLRKVPAAGGPPVPIASPLRVMFGASWGDDDVIVFGRQAGGLWEVPAAGGTPVARTETNRDAGEVSHRLPHVLPGGDAVLYTVVRNRFPNWAETEIWVHSRRSKTARLLIKGGADARFVANGHLLYATEGALFAVPFDQQRLEITGGAVGVSDVMQAAYVPGSLGDSGAMQVAISRTGTLVYLPGGVQPPSEYNVIGVGRDGKPDGLSIAVPTLRTLRLSPDGGHLALGTVGRDRGVLLYDFKRGALNTLVTASRGSAPVFMPDGDRIAFATAQNGPDSIFVVAADGGGSPTLLVKSVSNLVPGTWSNDGKQLLFYVVPNDAEPSDLSVPTIYVHEVGGNLEPRRITASSANTGGADLSPDGRWLAYDSTEAGIRHVFVDAYPGPGSHTQVSGAGGGGSPVWRGDGRELFYLAAVKGEQTMQAGDVEIAIMSVAVTATQPRLTFGTPRPLFSGRFGVNAPARGYDVSKDGRRFFMTQLRRRPPDVITNINLVQNWTEELRGRR